MLPIRLARNIREMLGTVSARLPRWLPLTIVGAMIMSILLAVVWSSFSSRVQHLNGDVQACLITICAGFVGGTNSLTLAASHCHPYPPVPYLIMSLCFRSEHVHGERGLEQLLPSK